MALLTEINVLQPQPHISLTHTNRKIEAKKITNNIFATNLIFSMLHSLAYYHINKNRFLYVCIFLSYLESFHSSL